MAHALTNQEHIREWADARGVSVAAKGRSAAPAPGRNAGDDADDDREAADEEDDDDFEDDDEFEDEDDGEDDTEEEEPS